MHAPPPAPAPDPADAPHPHRRALDELIETGLDVTRAIRAQANALAQAPADAATAALADIAVAFERAARAIRRTIALARHLEHAPAPRAQQRAAARRRILREVEDAIHRDDPDDEDDRRAELHERLDRPELDDEIDDRPVPEIIADICRDLGLAAALPGAQPWKRRTPADFAALCARAAVPPQSPAPAGRPVTPPDEPERFFRLVAFPND